MVLITKQPSFQRRFIIQDHEYRMNIAGTHYRTIWPAADNDKVVEVIDQRKLPHELCIKRLATLEDAHAAIRDMIVRGAGLIGTAAGYGMYLASLQAGTRSFGKDMKQAARFLTSARPTARNLGWATERIVARTAQCSSLRELQKRCFDEARAIADEDISCCRQIGRHGLELIRKIWEKNGKKRPVNILTHCNAGWLAFVDYGSATAPIYAARDDGIDLHVWVDETRPWNQGSRLTAWELTQEGIANTLITDNAGGHLMQKKEVDMVIVGSDRTTHTGDVANKTGTYLKALAARDNNIPFFVTLPSSTFDWNLDKGADIPIESRPGYEITSITGPTETGKMETVRLAAEHTQTANYSFDITPARLVTALITERGVVKADRMSIHSLFPEY